jgi:hypothetical protein
MEVYGEDDEVSVSHDTRKSKVKFRTCDPDFSQPKENYVSILPL